MDERVEEIKPISRVRPLRKLALARPARGGRELMYQLNQYDKAKKPKRTNLATKKLPDVSKGTDSNAIANSDDFVADLKKRVAFDRAMIIGD